jgi:hypothetical protein
MQLQAWSAQGTMGKGIAQVAALAGLKVVMVDVTDAALEIGRAALTASPDRLAAKDKLAATRRWRASLLRPRTVHRQYRYRSSDRSRPQGPHLDANRDRGARRRDDYFKYLFDFDHDAQSVAWKVVAFSRNALL